MENVIHHLKSLSKLNLRDYTCRIVTSINWINEDDRLVFLREDIRLVVWELLCNVIEHGELSEQESIEVKVVGEVDSIRITINPYSRNFTWSDRQRKDLQGFDNPKGRGLHIVEQLCDFTCNGNGKEAKAIFYMKNYL